jgi:hypothetical protein
MNKPAPDIVLALGAIPNPSSNAVLTFRLVQGLTLGDTSNRVPDSYAGGVAFRLAEDGNNERYTWSPAGRWRW